MSRLAAVFEKLATARRRALIPFITAGDPHPCDTVALMHGLVRGGADVIELGVPFSDPMADGPVIQRASERALRNGTSLWRVLDMVAEFRHTDDATPVVLMGYLNPIEARGVAVFARRAAEVGVDGVLVVDLAVEEAPEFTPALHEAGLDCIFLIAPTSDDTRIAAIAREASGYLYYVSLKGVTGSTRLDVASVAAKLEQIGRQTRLPTVVGFGIRDAASANQIGRIADGVVVGTALVSEIARHQNDVTLLTQLLADRMQTLRGALDSIE